MMKTFFTIICLALAATAVNAQTITDALRRDQQGQGKVVINHSAEIEHLVNNIQHNNSTTTNKEKATTNSNAPQQSASQKEHAQDAAGNNSQEQGHNMTEQRSENESVEVTMMEADPNATRKPRTIDRQLESNTDDAVVSNNKKIMRHSYKTTGYRIQVYSGGNKREDRTKCEQIAAHLKSVFPNMPIYVHFYSPSWKCRAGNFTDMGDAKKALQKIRSMGYKQAVMVKGSISVQY